MAHGVDRPLPLAVGESPPPLAGEKSVRFAGYAAVFDRVDRGGDVVRRGAFREAGAVPLLWQHKPDVPLGRIEAIGEDGHGLRVIGRLSSETQAGREAGALLRGGALKGLSFGYRVKAARKGTKRELTDLELVEVSLVTFPMQPLARVHAISGGE